MIRGAPMAARRDRWSLAVGSGRTTQDVPGNAAQVVVAGVPLMLGFVLLATADATMLRPRTVTLGVVR